MLPTSPTTRASTTEAGRREPPVTPAADAPHGARWSLLGSVLVGTGTFAVFAAGACPTIYVGDSGELVTAVHLLGIPHPTGYPLYVLLGKAWTLLVPIGSIAWRMSMFSAACAAAACALLHRVCVRANLHPIAGIFAALLFATGSSFWAEANVQRVYALGALFVIATTGVAWRWFRSRRPTTIVFAFFCCGLGATNHSFMTVYATVLAAFVVLSEPGILVRPTRLAAAVGAFAVGLLPYVYLPLRSRADPPLDWGNPETAAAFVDVVLRRDFWERAWIESPRDLVPVITDWLASLGSELTWIGAVLAALGVAAGIRRGLPVLLCILVIVGNVAAVALHGSRSDIFIWHRYYIPSYAMMALLAGVGCHALIERLPRTWRPLVLVLPLAQLALGWSAHDRSRYRVADDFARKVLAALPPGAHLAASDDNVLFSLLYLTLVENVRPDVDLIPQGVGDAELPALRFDPVTDPLYFTHHPNWERAALEVVPVGLLFRAWRAGDPPPPVVLPESLPAGADDPRVPKDYLTQNLLGHFHYMLGVTMEERDWVAARRAFTRAAETSPDNDVLFYNLGLIYRRNGLLDYAAAAFARAAAINPRHLASHSRPRAADREADVAADRAALAVLEASVRALPDTGLDATTPGSAAYHRRMAELLAPRDARFARGHLLLALELEAAGATPPPP